MSICFPVDYQLVYGPSDRTEDLSIEDRTVHGFALDFGRVGNCSGRVSPLVHLTMFTVSRPAARTVRGLAGIMATPSTATAPWVKSEDGVTLTADDGDDERGGQSYKHEDGRNNDDSCQRLRSVSGSYHVDKTIDRRTASHWGRGC